MRPGDTQQQAGSSSCTLTRLPETSAQTLSANIIDHMKRAAGMQRLLELLHTRVLPGVKAQDTALLELLAAMRCSLEVTPDEIHLRFTVGDLTNLLWRLAEEAALEVHSPDDWQADVRELALQLMNRWPDERLRQQAAVVNTFKVRKYGPLHANEYRLTISR